MTRQTVHLASTALRSATWDSETQTLEVVFVNGRDYTHEGVPEHVFDALATARSAGSYYARNIKGRY
jgi:hypothetical protein